MIKIEIEDKEYLVQEAKTEEERSRGLEGVKELPLDLGMLFYFEEPLLVSFWMKGTLIPLDIIFIDEDESVISVHKGLPNDETPIIEDNVKYVLEVNLNSGILQGDELDFEDEEESDTMLVLSPDGSVLMELEGGERIFSRKSTKVMIKKAKKAESVKGDTDKYKKACKLLGKYLFKELTAQDSRSPEYVSVDNTNKKE